MLVYFFIAFTITNVAGLSGLNVCNETRQQISYKLEPYHEPRAVNTRRLTWKPPFYKKFIRYEFDMKMKQVLHQVDVVVKVCCPGYKEVDEKCQPYCSNHCLYGECVAPDTCECLPGFFGDTCYVPCSNRHYGENCRHECECSIHSTCDVRTGECTCDDGWEGSLCDEKCQPGYHGPECSQQCSCHGNGMCHHVHGQCECDPGWMGPECGIRCPYPLFGPYCRKRCPCVYEHASSCDPENGKCNCLNGWIGSKCETSIDSEVDQTIQITPSVSALNTPGSEGVRISTILWTIFPFLLLFIAGIIFIILRKVWKDTIERAPLGECITFNSSTGSVVFSTTDQPSPVTGPGCVDRRTLPPPKSDLYQNDLPPTYENTIRHSAGKPIPLPDTSLCSTESTSTFVIKE